jgi:hypothetical protein
MSGSFWAGSIPPWAWVLYVCAAGIFIVLVLLASMSGRRRGYDAGYEDGRADMLDQVKEAGWRMPPLLELQQAHAERIGPKRVGRTSTAAFLNPPELHHEEPQPFADPYGWLDHTDQAMALANDDPTVSAWTQEMAQSMDAWLTEHVYSVPIPYLPGDEQR